MVLEWCDAYHGCMQSFKINKQNTKTKEVHSVNDPGYKNAIKYPTTKQGIWLSCEQQGVDFGENIFFAFHMCKLSIVSLHLQRMWDRWPSHPYQMLKGNTADEIFWLSRKKAM